MNFISSFLKDILEMIYAWVGNYGWAVIVFSFIIRIVILPLDFKSRKSMRKMSKIQPKVAALQKKYAGDQQKLNMKMQQLYRQEGVSPLSSCLPMLISLPILFCMYSAMRVLANEHIVQMLIDMMNGKEITFESFLWIKNVYQPDSFMAAVIPAVGDKLAQISVTPGTILTEENLAMVREFLASPQYAEAAARYGVEIVYNAPLLFWNLTVPAVCNGLFILPILAGATQFFSVKLTGNMNQSAQGGQADSMQQSTKMMNWMFPIFSVFICATATAGFSIYWVFINVFMIAEQWLLNKYFEKKEADEPKEVVQG